jgi:hypothetical protein
MGALYAKRHFRTRLATDKISQVNNHRTSTLLTTHSIKDNNKMPRKQEIDLEDEEPPSIEPYAILGINKSATADEVKSAYRKAALKHHPGMRFTFHSTSGNQTNPQISQNIVTRMTTTYVNFLRCMLTICFRQGYARVQRRSHPQVPRNCLRICRPLGSHPSQALRQHRLNR